MRAYNPAPARRDLLAWAGQRWPEGRFSSWRLPRLRAMWHRVNRQRHGSPAYPGPAREAARPRALGGSLNAAS